MIVDQVLELVKREVDPLPIAWAWWIYRPDESLTGTFRAAPLTIPERNIEKIDLPAVLLVNVGADGDGLICAYTLETDGALRSSKIGCPEAPGWQESLAPQLDALLRFFHERPSLQQLQDMAQDAGEEWSASLPLDQLVGYLDVDFARVATEWAARYPWLTAGQRFLVALSFYGGAGGEAARE